MNKLKIALFAILAIMPVALSAQIVTPITWSSSAKMTSADEGVITFAANIEPGWHLYGLNMPNDGPRSTVFNFQKISGAELVGGIVPSRQPIEKVDMIFNLKISWWESNVSFTQHFKLTPGSEGCSFSGTISFQGCNDKTCIPPTKDSFSVDVNGGATMAADDSEPIDEAAISDAPNAIKNVDSEGWWAPIELTDESNSSTESSWWYIFIWGFLGGLIALLTPCVWPMIPLTVSFFLKKNTSKARSIKDAVLYGAAIVVIYLALGLIITCIFGASKLNDLATNAIFNLLFFLLLVVFAVSFFGAFDIKLPAKWSNSMDSRAERTTGVLSIFFMAFTLALVSFSCTGPIIGTLLVEASTMGNIAGPAIGMGAFALALAIPFALFAIFPTWLKEMPRSGGWLNSVKVVLGFLELALSLKFLSVADLAYGWGILDREVFVSLWIVIFAMLGLYLLGKLRFSHDSAIEHVSITRFFLALASLSFSVYLVPGLWGAPLKSVSAFVPPLYTQDFNLYSSSEVKTFDDYDEGMAYASEHKLPVLIDFSGYGCVNCRKMEGAVFDTQEVQSLLKDNFVMITLMVDDKKMLPEPIEVVEDNGKTTLLETVGDRWSYLQRTKFKANSQPYYIVLDNQGRALTQPYYYDEDVAKFVGWLQNGNDNYKDIR